MVGNLGGSPIFTSLLCGMRGSVSSFQSAMSILFCGPAYVRIVFAYRLKSLMRVLSSFDWTVVAARRSLKLLTIIHFLPSWAARVGSGLDLQPFFLLPVTRVP
jgi:hypothetical protein